MLTIGQQKLVSTKANRLNFEKTIRGISQVSAMSRIKVRKNKIVLCEGGLGEQLSTAEMFYVSHKLFYANDCLSPAEIRAGEKVQAGTP